jgi:hypothetical protein
MESLIAMVEEEATENKSTNTTRKRPLDVCAEHVQHVNKRSKPNDELAERFQISAADLEQGGELEPSPKPYVNEDIPDLDEPPSSGEEIEFDTDESTGSFSDSIPEKDKYFARKIRHLTRPQRRKLYKEMYGSFTVTTPQERQQMLMEAEEKRINDNRLASIVDESICESARTRENTSEGLRRRTQLEAGEIQTSASNDVSSSNARNDQQQIVVTPRQTEIRRNDEQREESRDDRVAEASQMPRDESSFIWWEELDFSEIRFHNHHYEINDPYHEFKDWRFIMGRRIKDYNNVQVSWKAFVAKYNKGADYWYDFMINRVKVALRNKRPLIDEMQKMNLSPRSALFAARRELKLELSRDERDYRGENDNVDNWSRSTPNQWNDRVVDQHQQSNWNVDYPNTTQPHRERLESTANVAPRSFPDSQATSRDTSRRFSPSYDQLCSQLHNVESRLRESEARERAMMNALEEKVSKIDTELRETNARVLEWNRNSAKNAADSYKRHTHRYLELSRNTMKKQDLQEIQQRLETFQEKEKLQLHPVVVDILNRLTLLESQVESLVARRA